jgi:chaperonin cofactor prefoldin
LSGDVYDALMGEAGASLKWFCESCEKEISGLKTQTSSGNQKLDRIMDLMQRFLDTYEHMDTRLSEKADVDVTSQLEVRLRNLEERFLALDDRVGKVDDRASKLETRLHDKADKSDMESLGSELKLVVKRLDQIGEGKSNNAWVAMEDRGGGADTVQRAVAVKMDEDREIEARRANLIMYRVPEDRGASKDDRAEADKEFVANMCEEVFGFKVENGDVVKQFRLGSIPEDDRVRPLLVSFKAVETKELIMGNLKALKTCEPKYKTVGISHDLTPRQRKTVRDMLDEARKEQTQETGAENFKYIVVGAHKRPRVVRIKRD